MTKKEEVLQFSEAIEELVWQKDITYMEAIVTYCDETGLEIEMAAKLISEPLEAKIKSEANGLKMLKKSEANTSLPI